MEPAARCFDTDKFAYAAINHAEQTVEAIEAASDGHAIRQVPYTEKTTLQSGLAREIKAFREGDFEYWVNPIYLEAVRYLNAKVTLFFRESLKLAPRSLTGVATFDFFKQAIKDDQVNPSLAFMTPRDGFEINQIRIKSIDMLVTDWKVQRFSVTSPFVLGEQQEATQADGTTPEMKEAEKVLFTLVKTNEIYWGVNIARIASISPRPEGLLITFKDQISKLCTIPPCLTVSGAYEIIRMAILQHAHPILGATSGP